MTITYPIKSNDNLTDTTFAFPCPVPQVAGRDTELEIYARFMRHLRHVPNSRMEIKVLSSIQFTGDMLDVNDALVAKTLVDMGLRAPRKAFPASFLDYVDAAVMRSGWDVGGPSDAIVELKNHWDHIGEDRFAAFRKQYALREQKIIPEHVDG